MSAIPVYDESQGDNTFTIPKAQLAMKVALAPVAGVTLRVVKIEVGTRHLTPKSSVDVGKALLILVLTPLAS